MCVFFSLVRVQLNTQHIDLVRWLGRREEWYVERLLPLLHLVFSLLITIEPFRRYIKCVLATVEHKLSTKLLQKQCDVLECWKNRGRKVFTFARSFVMLLWSIGVCCVDALCRVYTVGIFWTYCCRTWWKIKINFHCVRNRIHACSQVPIKVK